MSNTDGNDGRPWYHRPEWIVAIIAVMSIFAGNIYSQAQVSAQTRTNTADIQQLKDDTVSVPERLGRIETKVDDMRESIKALAGDRG